MTSDSAIKVNVFIARDGGEYSRYSFEEREDENRGRDISSSECLFQWRYHLATRELRFLAHKKAFGGNNGYRILAPISEGGQLCNNLNTYVSKLVSDVRQLDEVEDQIIAHVELCFLEKLPGLLRQLSDWNANPILKEGVPIEYRVFIHWGGVEDWRMHAFEETVEQMLPPVWKVFSIGTDRNHLFPVDNDRIVIPCDMESLIKRFENASTFAGITDILTKFVVQGELENESVVSDFLARDDIRTELRTALRDKQMEWLKEWKAFQKYLAAEEDAKSKALEMMKDRGDRPKAFVTQLLTDRQLLSEGLLT